MLKSHGVAPGSRVVVAGLRAAAARRRGGPRQGRRRHRGGGRPVARAAWTKALPAIAGRPSLALRGAGWLARTMLAGVPLLSPWRAPRRGRHLRPARYSGSGRRGRRAGRGTGADLRGRCAHRRPWADDGLRGDAAAARGASLRKAARRLDPGRGRRLPHLDPGLHAIGDGAGIRGQEAATLAGRRVGLALGAPDATEAGRIDHGLAKLAPSRTPSPT